MKSLYGKSITNKGKIWLLIPLIVIVIAAAMFTGYALSYKDVTKGINIGVDFAGGTVITVTLGDSALDGNGYNDNLKNIEDAITSKEIAAKVSEYAKEMGKDLTADAAVGSISYAQRSGSGAAQAIVVKCDNISATYDTETNEITQYRNQLIEEQLRTIYTEEMGYGQDSILTQFISATASGALIRTALIAVSITLVLILIYISIRFKIWSALAAIAALMHDVLMMVALTIIFHVQINSAFIAAMITIVAYSINNTIVVFDRVRENTKRETGLNNGSVNVNGLVDKAIWETLLRSINSTLTTMIAIVLFAILGAASVREFALPVIFGLIAGFYSSLCLAPTLYCYMQNAYNKRSSGRLSPVKKNKQKSAGKIAGLD